MNTIWSAETEANSYQDDLFTESRQECKERRVYNMKWHEKKDLMTCSKSRLKGLGVKISIKDIKDVEYVARTPFGHVCRWTSDIIRVSMKNGDTYVYLSRPTSIHSAAYDYKLLTSSTAKKDVK